MRLFILGVSGLALTACSMGSGGYGYGPTQNQNYMPSSNTYGSWHHSKPVYGASYTPAPSSCHINPCNHAAPVQAYSPPTYVAPPAYEPPMRGCHTDPCSGGTYAVSPYAQSDSFSAGPTYGSYSNYNSSPYHAASAYQGVPELRRTKRPYIYGSLGIGLNHLVEIDVEESESIGSSVTGRLGVQSNSWFGAEADLSGGLSKSDSGLGFDVGINYQAAAFGVARIPFSKRNSSRFLARLGYHTTEFVAEDAFGKVRTSEDGMAFGLGLEFDVSPQSAIRLDATAYSVEENFDVSATNTSLSYLRRF